MRDQVITAPLAKFLLHKQRRLDNNISSQNSPNSRVAHLALVPIRLVKPKIMYTLFGEHNLNNLRALTRSNHISHETRQYHFVLGILVSRQSEFTNPLIAL